MSTAEDPVATLDQLLVQYDMACRVFGSEPDGKPLDSEDLLTRVRRAGNSPIRSGYALCLHHGVATGTVLGTPTGVKRGRPRMCYWNALLAVLQRPDLMYCEGYAYTKSVPFPFSHAMVYSPASGSFHEVTIDQERPLPVVAFRGLIFRPGYALTLAKKAAAGRQCGSAIEDWKGGWPLLRMTPEELSVAAITRDEFTTGKFA